MRRPRISIALLKCPFAFGMETSLRGKKVEKFPELPTAWLEAARKADVKLLVAPDELFPLQWPTFKKSPEGPRFLSVAH